LQIPLLYSDYFPGSFGLATGSLWPVFSIYF